MRVGRDRLSRSRRTRTGRIRRCAPVCGQLERVDQGSAAAGRDGRFRVTAPTRARPLAATETTHDTDKVLPVSLDTPTRKPGAGNGWSVDESLDLYQVPAWSKGYFSINAAGHVVVRPDTTPEREIDLFEVVQGLSERDLRTPVVVRFSDILAHRLRHLAESFAQAIAENDYKNRYAAVFPIKVNQQRLVVEEVYRYGRDHGFGLEVGSKPELLAVMAMTEGSPDRPIICNGFKDSSYIEAVTLATKLGRTIIPVVENFSELALILKHADTYRVRPRIGVRVKLASEGSGRWRESAGDRSKFG
ncbi:hypothetical protein EON77_15905, partial [bacterium]